MANQLLRVATRHDLIDAIISFDPLVECIEQPAVKLCIQQSGLGALRPECGMDARVLSVAAPLLG